MPPSTLLLLQMSIVLLLADCWANRHTCDISLIACFVVCPLTSSLACVGLDMITGPVPPAAE